MVPLVVVVLVVGIGLIGSICVFAIIREMERFLRDLW
jgi:tRNA A37 threonylcarbamoyladenosine dehydratase